MLTLSVYKEIIPILRSGGVGVMPTDTLYGVVGSALKKETVEKIYKLRKREADKPLIVLVSSLDNLEAFDISLNAQQKKILKKLWPGKVSVILSCSSKKFEYLHRGKKTLAVRVPDDNNLRKILKKTGPLVAPSANLSGEKPAQTSKEAKKYFSDKVDFYVDAGKLKSKPSTLLDLDGGGQITVLRQGAVKII